MKTFNNDTVQKNPSDTVGFQQSITKSDFSGHIMTRARKRQRQQQKDRKKRLSLLKNTKNVAGIYHQINYLQKEMEKMQQQQQSQPDLLHNRNFSLKSVSGAGTSALKQFSKGFQNSNQTNGSFKSKNKNTYKGHKKKNSIETPLKSKENKLNAKNTKIIKGSGLTENKKTFNDIFKKNRKDQQKQGFFKKGKSALTSFGNVGNQIKNFDVESLIQKAIKLFVKIAIKIVSFILIKLQLLLMSMLPMLIVIVVVSIFMTTIFFSDSFGSDSSSSSSSSYPSNPGSLSPAIDTNTQSLAENIAYINGKLREYGLKPINPNHEANFNGGSGGQCTWHVFNRISEFGKTLNVFGHGKDIAKNGKNAGYEFFARGQFNSLVNAYKNKSYIPPFVVSMPANVLQSHATFGHTAIIEKIDFDNKTVLISEMNILGNPWHYGLRTLTFDQINECDIVTPK